MSKRCIRLNSNVVSGHRRTNRTNPVGLDEYPMNSFFYRSTKKNFYSLWPMKSNSLKCSRIQTGHSIDLKFGMYIIGLIEFRINSSFTEVQKGFLYITAYGVKL